MLKTNGKKAAVPARTPNASKNYHVFKASRSVWSACRNCRFFTIRYTPYKMWVFTFFLILTACIRPHYTAQNVDIPDQWRVPTDEGSTLCNAHWWEAFHDPVLNDFIITALKNNQDLKIAMARVMAFYARLGVTNAAFYPAVYGNTSFTRTKSSIATAVFEPIEDIEPFPVGIKRITNDYQLFLSASWEPDFWGRVAGASEAAYADLVGQIQARRATAITVVSSVANAYIVLRQLDDQLIVSKKTAASREESLKLATSRFELGETSELEVKQAEATLEIAKIRVIEFEREIEIQENLLSILLGENPRAIQRGRSINEFAYPITIPAGLPSDLLTRRPDIMEAEAALIATNARVTEARALLFPQISLTGFYGSESSELHKLLTSPAEMWQYSISAIQTLFDAGRTCYLIKEAKARRDEALFNYRQTILEAFKDVDDALIAYEKNRRLVVEHEIQIKVLHDYLELARLRYLEGEVDYLNVLDAERSLFDAQLQGISAQADSFTAVVQIYKALGGGWVINADDIAIGIDDCKNEACDNSSGDSCEDE